MRYQDQIINESTGERIKELDLSKEEFTVSLAFAIGIQVRINHYMQGELGPRNFIESIIKLKTVQDISPGVMSLEQAAEWDDTDEPMDL